MGVPGAVTIDEVLDRVEINDLLVRYCAALRTKDLALLDDVFSPDAIIDYTRIGGSRSGVEDTKTWLALVLGAVERFDLYVGGRPVRVRSRSDLGDGVPPPGTDCSCRPMTTHRCRSTGTTRTGWSTPTSGASPNGWTSRPPGSSFPSIQRALPRQRKEA